MTETAGEARLAFDELLDTLREAADRFAGPEWGLSTPDEMASGLRLLSNLLEGGLVGHFEGDTLVVESAGFNEKTFVDATGAPHTDELRTVERIRKISPTELEDVITIHDPMYYTRDWQARFVYTLRHDLWLEDYVCGEPHRDLSSVAGVRRP